MTNTKEAWHIPQGSIDGMELHLYCKLGSDKIGTSPVYYYLGVEAMAVNCLVSFDILVTLGILGAYIVQWRSKWKELENT